MYALSTVPYGCCCHVILLCLDVTCAVVLLQLPSADECDALVHDRKLTAIVYFLDETFEELTYDVTTTVLEAVEQLAGIIKLQNYTTFTLYESRRVSYHAAAPIAECIFAVLAPLRCRVMSTSWRASVKVSKFWLARVLDCFSTFLILQESTWPKAVGATALP